MKGCIEEIPVEITVYDQLNIGSGTPSPRGANISLNMDDELNLPPSTLKGVLRKAASIAAPVVHGSWRPCPYVDPGLVAEKCRGPGYEWLILFGVPGEKKTRPVIVTRRLRAVLGDTGVKPPVHVYTHTAIDPGTMTVKKGALYSVEYLPVYTRLRGEILLDKCMLRQAAERRGAPASKLIRLLFTALLYLPIIGVGRKSRNIEVRLAASPGDVIDAVKELVDSGDMEMVKEVVSMLAKGFSLYTGIGEVD